MRDERANHDHGKQDRRIEGVAGNQQTDAGRQFQKAGKYRNHWPRPTLANRSTITAAPASLAAPAPTKVSVTSAERIQRVRRRPLPEAASGVLVVIIRFPLIATSFPNTYIDINIIDVNSRMR